MISPYISLLLKSKYYIVRLVAIIEKGKKMKIENILIVGFGVIIFLLSFSQVQSYGYSVFFFGIVGIVLVYYGIKRENMIKGKNK